MIRRIEKMGGALQGGLGFFLLTCPPDISKPRRITVLTSGSDSIGYNFIEGDRGGTVVKVLCYKSGGRWLDPSWCQWIFH